MEQILIIKLVYVFNLKTTIYIIISFKHGIQAIYEMHGTNIGITLFD